MDDYIRYFPVLFDCNAERSQIIRIKVRPLLAGIAYVYRFSAGSEARAYPAESSIMLRSDDPSGRQAAGTWAIQLRANGAK